MIYNRQDPNRGGSQQLGSTRSGSLETVSELVDPMDENQRTQTLFVVTE